jgi:hypothetical protein
MILVMTRFTRSACVGFAPLLLFASAAAQTVGPPTRLAEEFSAIRGARELPDGRLLVSDYRDQRVVVVDFDRKTVTRRIGIGSGPLEARLPTALVPAPGDSTVLIDVGNQRLLMLDAEGRVGRTIPGDHPGLMGLRGIDAGGGYYFAIPGWLERTSPLADDSVRVVRWQPSTGAEVTVAVIQGERMRSDARRPSRVPRIPIVGYAARDAWVVAERGIRVVRGGPYRVERWLTGGPTERGPSYRFETPPVTASDRLAFVREFNATNPTSGRGEGGGMGFSPAMTEREVAEMAARTEFAANHPMFVASRVFLEPGGILWVGLTTAARRPARYDRFDPAGRRLGSVELPAGRRIVAVGRSHRYLVYEAEDGVQFLERSALTSPATRTP